MDLKEVG